MLLGVVCMMLALLHYLTEIESVLTSAPQTQFTEYLTMTGTTSQD